MLPEQSALLNKAQENLAASRFLLENRYFDAAVSRAYYVMFYCASALLLGKGFSFSDHSMVSRAFGQHFSKLGLIPTEYHRYLIDAEQLRNIGDYSFSSSLTGADVLEQIQNAAKFVQWTAEFIALD